jgi:predicted CXXCH cytochrome family protein
VKRGALFILPALIASAALLLLAPSAGAIIPGHQCSYCHSLHGATVDNALLNNAQIEALCMTCHGPTGVSTLKADVHSNATPRSAYPPFRITCRGCHASHSNVPNWMLGTNIKLVGAVTTTKYAQIVTVNSGTRFVTFESRGFTAGGPTLHSFADSDQDGNGYYDGVCETCHTLTGHHRNNAPDLSHHTGDTCTKCHAHNNRFLK